jgi:hypothetical protein
MVATGQLLFTSHTPGCHAHGFGGACAFPCPRKAVGMAPQVSSCPKTSAYLFGPGQPVSSDAVSGFF